MLIKIVILFAALASVNSYGTGWKKSNEPEFSQNATIVTRHNTTNPPTITSTTPKDHITPITTSPITEKPIDITSTSPIKPPKEPVEEEPNEPLIKPPPNPNGNLNPTLQGCKLNYENGKEPTYKRDFTETAFDNYEFSYEVNNPETGDIKSHYEKSENGCVTGEYTLNDPDGYKRIVSLKINVFCKLS